MAKGSNKKKSGAKVKAASAEAKKAPKGDDVPPFVKRVETAYDLGNHAAVRALAGGAGEQQLEGKALTRVEDAFEKTQTDPLVWAIGAGALALALLVAMATLGG